MAGGGTAPGKLTLDPALGRFHSCRFEPEGGRGIRARGVAP